jgi:hypothetical protein
MLTLRRFKALADSYGAELQRWPDEVRGEAEALLNASPEARRFLAEAQTLDDVIEAASAQEDTMLWPPGEQSAALARLRSGVAARLTSSPPRRPVGRFLGWAPLGEAYRAISVYFGWVGLATGSGFAIVAGLLIGSMYAPTSAPHDVLTMLQPAPLQILAN